MDQTKSALERAFELAKGGTCLNVGEIRQKLNWEGYDTATIDGPALGRQLRGLIQKSATGRHIK
jgi:hypothetical protein